MTAVADVAGTDLGRAGALVDGAVGRAAVDGAEDGMAVVGSAPETGGGVVVDPASESSPLHPATSRTTATNAGQPRAGSGR